MAVIDDIITGSFTSDGNAKTLPIRCDVDYMEVVNYTQMATQQATGRGVKFEWFRGMSADTGVEYKKTNNTDALNGVVLASGGFTVVDTSAGTVGAQLTINTGISAANPAVVTLASTAGLSNGDVVRVYGTTGMLQIAGMDFTIGNLVANTTFELSYLDSSGFAAPATAGYVRKIYYDPIYYPKRLYITKITQATSAVVTTSVAHGLTVGQRIVFNIPSQFGMTQLNGLRGQITAVTTSTFTVNIDTSGFTAFAFPTSASVPFTFAQAIPFGDAPDTVANVNANQSVLTGATRNVSQLGMLLAAGAQSPAGSNGDVIYWKALKANQVQSS